MPLALLTTSRKTSNRVRSFVRDLWTVLPGTERFNRGGMSMAELVARIHQSGAKMALVVSLWKGNPRIIQFVSPTGENLLALKIESATLRRELLSSKGLRIVSVSTVTVGKESSGVAKHFAGFIAALMNHRVVESDGPVLVGLEGTNMVEIRIEDLGGGKILWTHYHTLNAQEIGPRIRIVEIRR